MGLLKPSVARFQAFMPYWNWLRHKDCVKCP